VLSLHHCYDRRAAELSFPVNNHVSSFGQPTAPGFVSNAQPVARVPQTGAEIVVNSRLPQYQKALGGDMRPLAAVLAHEAYHVAHGLPREVIVIWSLSSTAVGKKSPSRRR
jgi:hypothetical protein